MNKKTITNEMLHAFIDNELDQPEHDDVLTVLAADATLAERVNELRYFKQLVHAARPNVEFNCNKAVIKPRAIFSRPWVATAGLLVSTILIVALSLTIKPGGGEYPDNVINQINHDHNNYEVINAVAHLNGSINNPASQLLQHVQFLASLQQQLGKPINIDVIADGEGIKQLLVKNNVYQDQIESILNSYPNVRFIACLKSLENMNIDYEALLPGIKITKIGKKALAVRQQQGWINLNV